MNLIQEFKYIDLLANFGIGGAHPGGLHLTKEILMKENINNTSHILDVGCGTGQTAAYLAYTFGALVTGIDLNAIMIAKAKERMKKNSLPVNILAGSIENSPFPNQHFDLILSESVLSFVNQQKALKEIFRLLKQGGKLIAIEQTINKQLNKEVEHEIKQFYGFQSLNTQEDWLMYLKEAGFNQIQIQQGTSYASEPEYHFSDVIDPKLYEIMDKHLALTKKHLGDLDYRIYLCTK